jgi:hypothetical protein
VDNLDCSFLIFRAAKMMTAETERRDFDARFAKLSKWDGHLRPSQWSSGGRIRIALMHSQCQKRQTQISSDIAEFRDILLSTLESV